MHFRHFLSEYTADEGFNRNREKCIEGSNNGNETAGCVDVKSGAISNAVFGKHFAFFKCTQKI